MAKNTKKATKAKIKVALSKELFNLFSLVLNATDGCAELGALVDEDEEQMASYTAWDLANVGLVTYIDGVVAIPNSIQRLLLDGSMAVVADDGDDGAKRGAE